MEALNASKILSGQYLFSGHFLQSTFENRENEFLQMALFVILTISSSKKAPLNPKISKKQKRWTENLMPAERRQQWPVRKGGFLLKVYKHSLTISLLILFLISFALHIYGSLKDENEQNRLTGKPTETASSYLTGTRFCFESLQNWQSEFLSVCVLVVFSVFPSQKGSRQSKPVDAPDKETGE